MFFYHSPVEMTWEWWMHWNSKQVKVMNRTGLLLFMDDVCARLFSSHPQDVWVQTLCLSNKHSDLFTKLLQGLFFWWVFFAVFFPPSHPRGVIYTENYYSIVYQRSVFLLAAQPRHTKLTCMDNFKEETINRMRAISIYFL